MHEFDDFSTLQKDLGSLALPFLDDDISPVTETTRILQERPSSIDSAMASPPREAREINDYCLQWSQQTLLNSAVTPDGKLQSSDQ